jgi:hypothetical protein
MEDSRWATFAGGVLLGTAVAAGGTYFALKYAPSLRSRSLEPSEGEPGATQLPKHPSSKRRQGTPRNASPAPRHPPPRRASLAQPQHDSGSSNGIARTLTSDLYYYQTPARDAVPPSGMSNGNPHTHTHHHGSTDATRDRATAPARRNGTLPQRPPVALAFEETDTAALDVAGASTRDTMSESDAATMLSHHREPAIYAGPSDRANFFAAHEALRHTSHANLPSLLAGPQYTQPTNTHQSNHSHMALSSLPNASHGHPHHPHHHNNNAASTPGSNQRTPGSNHRGPVPYGESPAGTSAQGRSSLQLATGTPSPAPASTLAHTHAHAHGSVPPAPLPHVTTADALATEGRIIEDAALHEQYARVITPEAAPTEETEEVCWLLQRALDARRRWVFASEARPDRMGAQLLEEAMTVRECLSGDPFEYTPLPRSHLRCRMVDGVMMVYAPSGQATAATAPHSSSVSGNYERSRLRDSSTSNTSTGGDGVINGGPGVFEEDGFVPGETEVVFAPPGTATEFFSAMHWLLKVAAGGSVRSFTHQRLQLLEQKFNLHVMLNADKEFLAQKSAPHRDFYNVRKVDTHVHHSACMHQKHLLRFIKSKLKKEGDEVVIFRDGKYLTLKEVFESLNLTPYDLSVDTLDVHADKNIFHRFDKFNLKYNPFGQSRLREIFIKQDNLIHGRYLAEVTREVFVDLEASKYQHTEYRISVYGRKPVEWDTLAAWVVQNRLYSDNNVWMVQVPRLYNVYKAQGILESFQQLLDNIFVPLFEVTLDPSSHPMLHVFLRHVSGFDLVDDESKPERRPMKQMPTPAEWTSKHNPAYAYYMYYV